MGDWRVERIEPQLLLMRVGRRLINLGQVAWVSREESEIDRRDELWVYFVGSDEALGLAWEPEGRAVWAALLRLGRSADAADA